MYGNKNIFSTKKAKLLLNSNYYSNEGEVMRWALIGASDIAQTRVLPAIRANGDEAIVVRTGDLAHGEKWAKENSINEVVTDLDLMLSRPDIDAVYVSSLNSKHCEQVKASARAGKHVLSEKPLAMTVEDARAMVHACEKAGVVMATNHHLPANPVHRKIKEMISAGEIGKVKAIRFHTAVQLPAHLVGWRTELKEQGGVIHEVSVHAAAAVAALLGSRAISLNAIALNQDNDPSGPFDAVMTNILWEGGVLVSTHEAFNNPNLPTSLHVLGESGALVGENCNTGDPVGTLSLVRNHKYSAVALDQPEDLYIRTVRFFKSAIDGVGQPIISGVDGFNSLAVAVAIQESVLTGKRVDVARL